MAWEKLNGLDLFSGIGGITLALEPWVRPIAYCECERYAQGVLLSRMAEGLLPAAPIWDDVRTLRCSELPVRPEIIYGGFPCQDISVAGRGKGMDGERSSLFFEIARLAHESMARYIFLENVPAITTRGGIEVIETLTALRYDCRWGVLSASDMGAPHKRERWWLLAYSNSTGRERTIPIQHRTVVTSGDGQALSNPDQSRLEVRESSEDSDKLTSPFGGDWWESEPAICRVVNGLPYRLDRVKALGNAVVPAQAREAFCRLAGILID